ncbi:MAG: hypothetical protein LBK71_09765 [Verrucomicrobiales bacterium]|jgi:hypothetical protein|nr:hypothetical protein [Verrucomicrobiales bacterium]
MKPLKEARLSLRLSQGLKDRLTVLESETGIPSTILAVEGLEAICDYYALKKVITLPLAVLPRPELVALQVSPTRKKAR